MYTRITIYGLIKKSVMPLFIFWITFLLDLALNFIGKLLVGTNCAPFVTDLFLFCYESLSRENQADITEALNSTSRHLGGHFGTLLRQGYRYFKLR